MSNCSFPRKSDIFYGNDVRASKALRTNLITSYGCCSGAGSKCLTINNAYLVVCEKGITTSEGVNLNVLTSLDDSGNSGTMVIETGASTNNAGSILITAGSGTTGGNTIVRGGQSNSANSGGSVALISGGSTSGTTGEVTIASSTASIAGQSGDVNITSGINGGVGSSGDINLTSGNSNGNSGSILIASGNAITSSGIINIETADSNNAGNINITVGNSIGTNLFGKSVNIKAGLKSAGAGNDDGIVRLNPNVANGVLFPSFDTSTIVSPIAGLVAFNTVNSKLEVFDGVGWIPLH